MHTASTTDVATTAALTALKLRVARELAELLSDEDLDTAAAVVERGLRDLAPTISGELRTRGRRVGADTDHYDTISLLIEHWGAGDDANVAAALDAWGKHNCTACACAVFDGHGCGDHAEVAQ